MSAFVYCDAFDEFRNLIQWQLLVQGLPHLDQLLISLFVYSKLILRIL
jgi:hypothetical protein